MFDTKTSAAATATINPDGMTYRHKPAGSPFNGGAGLKGQTMSCFLCGKHRPRSSLKSRRLVGRNHVVCAPDCHTVEDSLDGRS